MTTTTTAPPAMTALSFYERAQPLVEELLAMARQWREQAPYDGDAVEAHSMCFWLATRVDLKLSRCRLTTGGPKATQGGGNR